MELKALTQEARSRWSQADGLIYLAYRGSIAHGMYTPTIGGIDLDDIDLMGVVVPPLDHYFGLKNYGNRGTREINNPPWDVVLYEARKMLSLLANCNPNVIACLFVRHEHVIRANEAGELLRRRRYIFLSRDLYKPFIGYANSQLHRMRLQKREGKRRELVERFGYDTKHAAHLIRLLRVGEEALLQGTINVYRNDAEELLSIKRGERTRAEIEVEAEDRFERCRQARDKSPLPEHVDREAVNKLCADLVAMTHHISY